MALTITSPANGATVTGTINVTATVSGSTNGFNSAELLVDGAVRAQGTLSGKTITCVFDTAMLQTNVTHTIVVRAKIKGAIYNSNTVTVTVGNVVAASISQNIAPGATLNANKTWTATLTGITATKAVLFAIDGAARTTVPSAPYTYVLDTTGIPDGSHTFYVGITDVNGKDFTSTVTATVSNVTGAAPVNTSAPTISPATYQQGTILTAAKGTWTGSPTPTYTYQWYRCDSAGANCVTIAGATNPTYTLVLADVGSTVKVRVKAVNASAPAGVTADSAHTGVIQASGGGGGTPPSGFYLYETWESGAVPSPWTPSTFFNYQGAAASVAIVTDPLGQKGKVARMSCPYTPGTMAIDANYPSSILQQAAINITPSEAHATKGDETWYRADFMFPAGNVFCNGYSNFLVEWHTQATGPTSSGLFAYGSYPLTTGGTTAPKLVFVVRSGDINAPTQRFYPGNTTQVETSSGITIQSNHWYKSVWHFKWRADGTGFTEWFLDDVLVMSVAGANHFTSLAEVLSFASYNYRYHVTGNSNIYYDVMALGPTRASIGG